MKSFLFAVGFLTSIPVPTRADFSPKVFGRSGRWFPVIGLSLGAILFGSYWLLGRVFPPMLQAAAVTAIWALLTGALHLDGLADCADGLLVTASKTRRLEILKDSSTGAFGAVALILFLLVKFAAIASLTDLRAILLAPLIGRWVMLLIARFPPARPGGMGAMFREGLSMPVLVFGGALTLAASLLTGWRGILALILALLVALGVGKLALNRIDGVTGDVLGAACVLAELSVLLVFAGETLL
jgi:adenosylcobinamide-GDP ribazoletransferase